jgi:hypothetical protein
MPINMSQIATEQNFSIGGENAAAQPEVEGPSYPIASQSEIPDPNESLVEGQIDPIIEAGNVGSAGTAIQESVEKANPTLKQTTLSNATINPELDSAKMREMIARRNGGKNGVGFPISDN